MELINEVEEFCIKKHLISSGDRIVVGVSGGPDSLCLLTLLNQMSKRYDFKLFVVHINHSLRDEADFEEEYVKKYCEKLDIEFFSKKIDILKISKEEKRSTEEVAREKRYEFFYEVLNKVDGNKIAVAHNKNDNAETILLNLLRGCGTEGLNGIVEKNGSIIRPLINISRKEIERFCNENGLTPMIDKSNFENVYTRNKIRNLIIPRLEEINPDIINGLFRFSRIIRDDEEFINDYVELVYSEVAQVDSENIYILKDKFSALKIGLKRRVLRKAICDFTGSLKDVSFSTINNAIKEFEYSKNGSLIKILNNVNVLVEYNKLKFIKNKKEIEDYIYELNVPGKTYIKELNKWIITEVKPSCDVGDIEKNPNIHFFDIEKTGKKLYVRNRKNGDYFFPTGILGKKKIKDFFSDLKIENSKRYQIPIITNGNEIIWVVGFRSSRKFLKDKSTKEVIIINYGENI